MIQSLKDIKNLQGLYCKFKVFHSFQASTRRFQDQIRPTLRGIAHIP